MAKSKGRHLADLISSSGTVIAVDNLIDAAPGALDTLNELAAALGDDPNFATTVTNSIAAKLPLAGGTLTGNVSFGDNDKATFGDGDDLQIYHDGSHSRIADIGTGDLRIYGDSLQLNSWTSANNYLTAVTAGAVNIYHNGSSKLATTATGIDVTGTITADGLDLGDASVLNVGTIALDTIKGDADDNTNIAFAGSDTTTFTQGGTQRLSVNPTGINVTGTATMDGLTVTGTLGNFAVNTEGVIASFSRPTTSYIRATDAAGQLRFDTGGSIARMFIANNGDISFYNTAGTSQSLFWDASAETLGIGNTVPSASYSIDAAKGIRSSGAAPNFTLQETDTGNQSWLMASYGGTFAVRDTTVSGTAYPLQIQAATPSNTLYLTSSGNVGIGTSSPVACLDVNPAASTTVATARFLGNFGTGSASFINQSGLSYYFNQSNGFTESTLVYGASANSFLALGHHNGTSYAERMRIDASGNVGIGTNAPSKTLSVVGNLQVDSGATNADVSFVADDGYDIYLGFGTAADRYASHIRKDLGITKQLTISAETTLALKTNDTERARLTSNGNLLVGTTTTNIATEGTVIYGSGNEGVMQLSSTNMTALYVNRSNSGELVQFRTGGSTTVGSIGNSANDLTIYSTEVGHNGLRMHVNGILPTDNTGAIVDADADLGDPSYRFKDLYLSGGVYLGGTGAANKLDEYEEGTWTPSLVNGTSITYTTTPTGSYTKIGKIVHISASIDVSNSDTADASGLTIGSLPFSAVGDAMTFTLGRYRGFLAAKGAVVLGAAASGTFIQVFESNNNFVLYSEIGSSGILTFSGTYEAA